MKRMWVAATAVMVMWSATASAGESLADWELEFGGEVLKAAVGRQCSYYVLHAPNSSPNAPGLKGALATVNTHGAGTDWRLVLVCVNHADGKIRWSRAVGNYTHLSVDPRNDDAHIYDRLCITLGAGDGQVLKKSGILPGRGRLDGVMIGSRILGERAPDPRKDASRRWILAQPDSGTKIDIDVIAKRLLSPDEKWRLRVESEGSYHRLSCYTVIDNRKIWSYARQVAPPVLFAQMPVLSKGRVYWLNGSSSRRTELVCLEGASGKVVWKRTMPNAIYWPSGHQLRGGGYPKRFATLRLEGEKLATLDAAGRLYVLDANTGRTLWGFHPSSRYLCPPAIRGDSLIVCTFRSIRRYRISRIRGPQAREKLVAAMRALLKARRPDKALTAALTAIRHDLDFAGAYRLAAEALERLDRADEGLFFRARAVGLSGAGTDPVLASRIGLERIVALGSPVGMQCQMLGKYLCAGTLDGRLMAIDTRTLEARRLAEVGEEMAALLAPSGQLRFRDHSSRCTVHPITLRANFDAPPGAADPLWFSASGSRGRRVFYRGDYYRPINRGVIRWVPRQHRSILYESPLQLTGRGSHEWNICLSASGRHYGYGPGGVTVLDDHLCPGKWLVHLPKGTASHLECGKEHVGGLFRESGAKRQMRIYSREGKLLRAASTSGISFRPLGGQFLRHNGGYLLSGMELLYMHPDREVPVIRLARPGAKDTAPVDSAWGGRRSLFGPPTLANDRLFVATRDGCIYVFDAGFFGRSRPAPAGR